MSPRGGVIQKWAFGESKEQTAFKDAVLTILGGCLCHRWT